MQSDGLAPPRRYWSALVIGLGIFLAVLDSSLVNVALPTIARDLGVSSAGSIWVVNAYQIALVAALLPSASLGEIFGYRRVYRWGLAIFTLASLACALADSLPALTAARALQGVGAAGLLGVNGALVRHTYPQARLGRGISINAAVVGAALAMGPPVCSAVLAIASWPWLFAINVPIGLVLMALAGRALPTTDPAPRRFDLTGALLNAAAFGLLILGVEGLVHGGRPVLAGVELVLGVAAGTVLVLRSLAQPTPLAPVDLLRIPVLRLSLVTGLCAFSAHMAAGLALPFVLQYEHGRTAVETGLLMIPWPLAMVAAAPLAGRLADRRSAGLLGGVGLLVMTAGLVLLATLPPAPTAFDLGWRMALCGLGFAFFQSPNNRAIMAAAPMARAGAAGGLLAVCRLLGFTAGATLVAVLFHLRPNDYSPVVPMLSAAAFALAGAAASFSRMRREPTL